MGQQIRSQYDPDADPEIEFEKPAALAQSLELNLAEKRDALMRWEDLVRRRLEAGGEGMPTNGKACADADLLQEIGKQLLDLEHRRGIIDKSRRRQAVKQPAPKDNAAGGSTPKEGTGSPAGLQEKRTGPFDDPPRRPS